MPIQLLSADASYPGGRLLFNRNTGQEGKQTDMQDHPIDNSTVMTRNVQGFELPTGCLMTSVLILTPVLALLIGLVL